MSKKKTVIMLKEENYVEVPGPSKKKVVYNNGQVYFRCTKRRHQIGNSFTLEYHRSISKDGWDRYCAQWENGEKNIEKFIGLGLDPKPTFKITKYLEKKDGSNPDDTMYRWNISHDPIEPVEQATEEVTEEEVTKKKKEKGSCLPIPDGVLGIIDKTKDFKLKKNSLYWFPLSGKELKELRKWVKLEKQPGELKVSDVLSYNPEFFERPEKVFEEEHLISGNLETHDDRPAIVREILRAPLAMSLAGLQVSQIAGYIRKLEAIRSQGPATVEKYSTPAYPEGNDITRWIIDNLRLGNKGPHALGADKGDIINLVKLRNEFRQGSETTGGMSKERLCECCQLKPAMDHGHICDECKEKFIDFSTSSLNDQPSESDPYDPISPTHDIDPRNCAPLLFNPDEEKKEDSSRNKLAQELFEFVDEKVTLLRKDLLEGRRDTPEKFVFFFKDEGIDFNAEVIFDSDKERPAPKRKKSENTRLLSEIRGLHYDTREEIIENTKFTAWVTGIAAFLVLLSFFISFISSHSAMR